MRFVRLRRTALPDKTTRGQIDGWMVRGSARDKLEALHLHKYPTMILDLYGPYGPYRPLDAL